MAKELKALGLWLLSPPHPPPLFSLPGLQKKTPTLSKTCLESSQPVTQKIHITEAARATTNSNSKYSCRELPCPGERHAPPPPAAPAAPGDTRLSCPAPASTRSSRTCPLEQSRSAFEAPHLAAASPFHPSRSLSPGLLSSPEHCEPLQTSPSPSSPGSSSGIFTHWDGHGGVPRAQSGALARLWAGSR